MSQRLALPNRRNHITQKDRIARLMSLALQYGLRLRRSVISSQAPSLPHAARCLGTITSSLARVCRISSAGICWWNTAAVTSWGMCR
jgi:hypothetical protein